MITGLIREYLCENPGHKCIITGDLSMRDLCRPEQSQGDSGRNIMEACINEFNLESVNQVGQPNRKLQPTFKNISTLDYIFLSKNLLKRCEEYKVPHTTVSDHHPSPSI